MTIAAWIILALALHTARPYVLLTANIDDVTSLAKQVLSPEVVNQFNSAMRRTAQSLDNVGLLSQLTKLWKRASDQFQRQLNEPSPRYRLRASDTRKETRRSKHSAQDVQNPTVGHKYDDDELLALGKNASFYLQHIRKLFENLR